MNNLSKDKESFNKMVLLTLVKIFGIVFSFAIPMYLGRKLSIESYGTYKQVFLFYWFAQVALNLGFDDSAYFYLRRDPKKFPLYSFNALFFNLLVMGLLWIILSLYAGKISTLINNPSLAQFLPILGYLILATISSQQIEGILIGLNRFKERLILEMGMELLKSVAILAGFIFFNSIYAVLVLLSILMSVKLLLTVLIIIKYKKLENLKIRDSFQYFYLQAKFGLPLGFSRILQNILNLENLFISSFFSLTQYTIYAVGCFENPLINAAKVSLFELANIEMVDATKHDDYKKALQIFRSMNRKLFLIIIPFIIYMIFFAHEIISFIFSTKYLESIPYFAVFNLYIFANALSPEPLFRSTHNTHMALRIRTIGVILGLILIISGAYFLGPIFALVGKIMGILIINITGLIIGANLIHSNFSNLFNWKELSKTLIVSLILSILLRLIFNNLVGWHPFYILALSFSAYLILHFISSCYINLIKDDEIAHLKDMFTKIIYKVKRK